MALILVIDDDTTQRFAAKFSLEKAGHKVIEATDGVEGLAQVRARLPDVVVCDVVMPRMDGHRFLAALREDSRIAGVPVLLVTSLGERADVRKGMNSGADDYLTKPFKFAELVEAVQGLVDKRVQRESQAARSALADLEAAMESQKHELSLRYEVQMLNELNARWTQKERANEQVLFPDAVLLYVGIFAAPISASPSIAEADELRGTYRHAKDQLKMFGARHVLPQGNDLLAVFLDDDSVPVALTAAAQAGRAAAGLTRFVRVQAMARGALCLLQVADALHGGPESQLLGGAVFEEVLALRDMAVAHGWRVVAAPALRAGLEGHGAALRLEATPVAASVVLRME